MNLNSRLLFCFICIVICACQNPSATTAPSQVPEPTSTKVNTSKEQTDAQSTKTAKPYSIMARSKIKWTGSQFKKQHSGTLDIVDGVIEVIDNKIVGGKVIIDMNSLINTDLKAGEGKEKLEGHLKSEDFFDVANHPTATFEITNIKNTLVTGDLTIKGITKSITFPAIFDVHWEHLRVATNYFNIDRTDWNIKYGSTKFFDNLKDKAISDQLSIQLALFCQQKLD